MLDNLKLGYGGTKAELERLIADAASYTEIQKEMGITVDASSTSFDNIVNAIAVVQGKLGIAGATALEAGTTIEGSVNSMKAAWDNLITGVADKNADLEGLIGDFVTTIVGDGTESNLGVLGNIMPAVKSALNGASRLVSEMIPIIVQEIPTIINDNLPVLAEAAISIIQSLVDGISENQEMLMETAFETITFLAESLIEMLPQIVELGLDLIVSLANGIAESLPELIPTIVDVILQIVETLTNPDSLSKILNAALVLIVKLAYGIIEAIPELIDSAFEVIENLITFLCDPENLAMLVSAALELIVALAGGLIAAIPELVAAAGELITSLVDKFKENDWGQTGRDIIDEILSGLKNAWESVKTWFTNAWNNLFSNRTVSVGANVSGSGVDGSHAGGLDYVPFNGYIAELHKGERVLTASENMAYSRGLDGITVYNTFNGEYTERDGAKIVRSINRQLGALV